MKSFFIKTAFLFSLCIPAVTMAQTSDAVDYSPTAKGQSFISPNLGYTHYLDLPAGHTTFDISLNSDQGYFLFKNFAITTTIGVNYDHYGVSSSSSSSQEPYSYYTYSSTGGKIWHTGYKWVTTGSSGSSSNQFLISYGAGVRYYILEKIFVGSSLKSYTKNFSDFSTFLDLQLGYSYKIKDHLSLDASVDYLKGIGTADGCKAIQGKIGIGFYL
jgi:hypothetical protein